MFKDICAWLESWIEQEDGSLEILDDWDLLIVRSDTWDEWIQIHDGIYRTEEQIKKEREVLDCLLLSMKLWAEKTAPKFNNDEVDAFINHLTQTKQTGQHTADWYREKIGLLTASEFGDVIKATAPGTRRNVYKKKFEKLAALEAGADPAAFANNGAPVGLSNDNNVLSPTVWGHRFEPIARDLASVMFFGGGHIIDDIGRIVHPTLSKLAASPDGLIVDGPCRGNLIEIKCPLTRNLEDDEITEKYYAQTQIQMEVTGAPRVEFVEMKFRQSPEPPDSIAGGRIGAGGCPATVPAEDYLGFWGVITVIDSSGMDTDDPEERLVYNLRYEYGPITKGSYEREMLLAWVPPLKEGDTIIERMYWCLEDYHHKTIYRNPRWWQQIGLPGYQKFWEDWDSELAMWRESHKQTSMFIDDSESDEEITP